MSFKKKCG